VGDRACRHAWSEERPHGHAAALPPARDLERHLLPGQERRHLESTSPRFTTLAGRVAAVPALAGQRGTLDAVHEALRAGVRQKEGRRAHPSAAILDSQSVRVAEKRGAAGATTRARRSPDASDTSSRTPSG
jgi:hypothetical protein